MSSKAVEYENIILQVSFKIVKTNPADPITMYVFNIEKLNKQVFRKRKVGFYLRQCIYAHWLEDSANQLAFYQERTGRIIERLAKQHPKEIVNQKIKQLMLDNKENF